MKHLPATRYQPSEAVIHKAVCAHLTKRAKSGVVWLHPPNGEARQMVTGARLKAMGVLPGAADLLFWHNGASYALELKRTGGRLLKGQRTFLQAFEAAGGTWAVAYGLDEALDILTQWGLIR